MRLIRFALVALAFAVWLPAAYGERPNIIFILADDLGYGDVGVYNKEGKIATPHLDRLAAEGMRFTDAHTSSGVCTPTRYGLLTGRYNWRSRLKSGVLGGMSPRLIEPGRLTVAALLQKQGYRTACIGKWHLGFDWTLKPDAAPFGNGIEKGEQGWRVDFTQPFQNGPTTLGFDYFFGISASLDMVPYTFLENDRVQVVPTVDRAFPMMQGRQGGETRRGPGAPEFTAEGVLPALTRKAVEFIGKTDADRAKPFFLYVPFASPHTPIAANKEWVGKSGLNPYADFVMETDAAVGEIVRAVEEAGIAENTLIIFTSDNGCSPQAKFEELAAKGHHPSAGLRGAKADIFEGGHRVPFIVRWPKQVRAGSESGALITLNDFMATCAEIVATPLPENAGEDSVSFLPALMGKEAGQPAREGVVHHSINGSFAIRSGDWKLILAGDSGGWSVPRPNTPAAKGLPPVQLYDLGKDLGEKENVAAENPEVVERLTALLERYVKQGRSTPGAPQPNTGEVRITRADK